MSRVIILLETAFQENAKLVGNKALNLGKLIAAGFPVPKGFVIPSFVFESFLQKTVERKLLEDTIKMTCFNTPQAKNPFKLVQNKIIAGKLPHPIQDEILESFNRLKTTYVAVRSSAISEDTQEASFAGQFDTFLNTDKDSLIDNIKRCWASCFNFRAISYRTNKKISNDRFKMAVIVQHTVKGQFSGIMFTMNPVSKDKTKIVIEAIKGTGEKAVSGKINPNHFILNKKTLKVEESLQDKQRSLDASLLKKLGESGLKIEALFHDPQDIEWTIKNGEIFFLQSRPISLTQITI